MPVNFFSSNGSRWVMSLGLAIALIAVASSSAKSHPRSSPADRLKRLSIEELDVLFMRGSVVLPPAGLAQGHVVRMTNTRLPRVKRVMANTVWKGKEFEEDGEFINQFPGFQAFRSCLTTGESWFDGQPCIVLEYPPKTPFFANVRDEIREIEPGVFLGRLYDKAPCRTFRGYFILEFPCPCR